MSSRATVRARAATAAVTLAALAAGACRPEVDFEAEARTLTQGGEATRGHALIARYGCGSCHVVPGVDGATGNVGPSLATFRTRPFVAGVLPHTPENLMRWIMDPPGVDSLTAMPRLGVTSGEARDIAAYLYALDR